MPDTHGGGYTAHVAQSGDPAARIPSLSRARAVATGALELLRFSSRPPISSLPLLLYALYPFFRSNIFLLTVPRFNVNLYSGLRLVPRGSRFKDEFGTR